MRTATLIENLELLAFGIVGRLLVRKSGKATGFSEDFKNFPNLCRRKSPQLGIPRDSRNPAFGNHENFHELVS